ncbi:hypothetical protein HD806DRAFT_502778 [Xylariaceae sp. AK1471]|nr:hypothetical protein HD806DRAFT_502778 [Xylariaceae sp. AK1471]
MSRLTEYSFLLAYIKRRFEGEEPTIKMDHGQFGGVTVRLPLAGIPALDNVTEFYSRLNTEVERSRLEPERKIVYRQFACAAYLAHHVVAENQLQWGTVWHLQDCITYITQAFRLMERSKEYDDGHPVHWSEVYQSEGSEHQTPPAEYWLLFKLESLLPVLRLSVRVFRLIFSDCSGTWDEWEGSLCRKDWLQQFILDSRKLSWREIPLHAPRRVDIVGSSTSGTPLSENL